MVSHIFCLKYGQLGVRIEFLGVKKELSAVLSDGGNARCEE